MLQAGALKHVNSKLHRVNQDCEASEPKGDQWPQEQSSLITQANNLAGLCNKHVN